MPDRCRAQCMKCAARQDQSPRMNIMIAQHNFQRTACISGASMCAHLVWEAHEED